MSVRMTVSTRSTKGLAANFFAADAKARRICRETTAKYGEKQFRLTRELAPVDTGFLRSQIRLRFSDDGLVYEVGFREEDFTGEGKPPYFVYTEFGTRFMAARPCVFPARDQIAPEYRRALAANLRGAIRRRGAQ